jgi:hypothetical protein
MKTSFFSAAAFMVAICVTVQLKAQVTNEKTTGWNLKENVKGRVSSSSSGCDIVFTHEVTSPRDASTGMATGKRQHKPYSFFISSADNSVTENTGASGTAAKSSGGGGKASFSDLSVMINIKGRSQKLEVTDGEFSLPQNCPDGTCEMIVSWSWGASNSGSTKRCSTGFSVTIDQGACMAINEKGLPGNKGTTKN